MRVKPDPPILKPGIGVNVLTSSIAHIAEGVVGLAKAAAGVDPAPIEVRRERRGICDACEHRKGRRCGVCHCVIAAKVRLAGAACPLPEPKWGPVEPRKQA